MKKILITLICSLFILSSCSNLEDTKKIEELEKKISQLELNIKNLEKQNNSSQLNEKILTINTSIENINKKIWSKDNTKYLEKKYLCDLVDSVFAERKIITDYIIKNWWDNPYSSKYWIWIKNPVLSDKEIFIYCSN